VTAIIAKIDFLVEITALISIPVSVFFLIYYKNISSQQKRTHVRSTSIHLTLNYIAIIGIVIGIASIVVSLLGLLFSIHLPIRTYLNPIFLFFSSFSPILIILLVFYFPLKLLLTESLAGISRVGKGWFLQSFSSKELLVTKNLRKRTKILYLTLIIALFIGLGLIPHHPTINEDSQQIGSDTHHYVNWINSLLETNSISVFLQKAFVELQGGDRPLTLLLLFGLTKIVNASPFYVIEYVPIILGPALVLAVYFLTRELTLNDMTSLYAAFLTATSFQVLIGIYAGFYANWFALIFGYLAFVFLFRSLKSSRLRDILIFSVSTILLLLTHVYTWSILAIVEGLFLIVGLIFKYHCRRIAIILLLVVLSSVGFDIVRTAVTGSWGGVGQDIKLSQTKVGIEQLSARWDNLIDATQHKLGSLYSNFIILLLALFWLVRSNIRVPYNLFLAIFLSVGILPIFLGDWVVQSRIFYNIPFQIPAAIALACIREKYPRIIILTPICIWLIAISIRALSNLYLVLP
jgi:hypothetical protein